MSYKVNFVSSEDFDRLPGKNMETKVGVAYPEYGEAYVRETGVQVIDVFTAIHELEHLKGSDLDEHFDKENRCYYKNFGQMMGPIGSVVGSMIGGPAGGAIGGGLGGLFGGGKQAQPQQQQMPQFNMQPMQAQNPPNVIQTQANGAGQSGVTGASGQAGAKTGSMDDALKQYGFYGGR